MNLFSWAMCAWSLCTMYLFSERRYRIGWVSSIASQFGWIYISCQSGLWGMFAYSTIMLGVGARALYKLRNETLNT